MTDVAALADLVPSNHAENLAEDLVRMRALRGIKWTRHADDVLPVWVADMDLSPPAVALEAVRSVVDRGDLGYNFEAKDQLADAFVDWQEVEHGWRPDVERVVHFNTVLHAIELILWEVARGEGVLLLTPIYPPFLAGVADAGCVMVDCPLDPTTGVLTAEALERAIDGAATDGTPVTTILMCNPHNPSGRSFRRSELVVLAEAAEAHDLLVISDEVWADLLHPGSPEDPIAHIPFATVSEDAACRTVTISSASKAFNLAGLRTAVAHFGHDQTLRAVKAVPAHALGGTNVPGAEATLACWLHGREWLAETRAHLTAQRDHLTMRLERDLPELGYRQPESTYLAWLDCRELRLEGSPADYFLERGRVAFSPGETFGHRGVGFVRLNFATTRAILDEVLNRMIASIR